MYDIKNLNIWKTEQRPDRLCSDLLATDITEMNLSVRSYNCLRRAGCQTVGDILRLVENDEAGLRKIRNLGTRSETEILENLKTLLSENRTISPAGSILSGNDPAAGIPLADGKDPAEDGPSVITRRSIQRDKQLWNAEIERFHLSNYAYSRLKQHGIDRVRDLYANNPKNEPGWYAVRELLEKIPAEKENVAP